MSPAILLTFDVEDWFQVENLRQCCPVSAWSSFDLRVERNTHRLLDLLDALELKKTADRIQHTELSGESCKSCLTGISPKATFFVLGWIAERLPNLVREIHARGHEVASHGYSHSLCSECGGEDLRSDLLSSRKLLEDITGERVYGYRAPSFSVSDDVMKVISECGYLYDSSYNSFAMNPRYGRLSLNGNRLAGIAYEIADSFFELPISNLEIGGRVLPWGGGGYFRLIPSVLFKLGVRSILKRDNAYLFYMHPWEIDPEQPRMEELSRLSSFRHYVNISKTGEKLKRLVTEFGACRYLTCRQYIDTLKEGLKGRKDCLTQSPQRTQSTNCSLYIKDRYSL